jgi:rare lipoprotein A
MRHRAAAALAAATTLLLPATSTATGHAHHRPKRVGSHISLHLSRHDLLGGRTVVASGRFAPGGPHRVKIVLRGGLGGAVARTATNRNGGFRVRLGTSRTGIYSVKAYGVHGRRVAASASAVRRFTVYRQAMASYYGPGLYGHGVACGGTLMPGTLGVANRSLPCGTKVRLRYHGRSVTVPVIDRGPYVAGRDYDLTTATKERLRFPGLGVVLSSR